jgi:hypothetical protein
MVITGPTGDMDVWVNRTPDYYKKLMNAFNHFGLPSFEMTEKNFLDWEKNDVFTFGRPPVCIKILTKLKGVELKKHIKELNCLRKKM